MLREQEMDKVRFRAEEAAEDRILDVLLTPARQQDSSASGDSSTRQLLRKKLREGELDDREVEIELSSSAGGVEIMAPPGMEEMTNQLQSMFSNLSGQQTRTRKVTVKAAFAHLCDEEAAKLVNEDDLKQRALNNAEQTGIVFLDELDKVAKRGETSGADVSREGVQRDLLPLIEGCTVSTKYGMIKTDHILFVASGAFHFSKPSDLIPELQGRLPIRVELQALSAGDFERILQEPDASLTEQYQALLATEGLHVEFTEDGIGRIAEIAWQVNESTENIGARRLHTVMERLLEDASFNATDSSLQKSTLTIDANYVDDQLAELSRDEDLSRFIL
jgi:ATP-dependent HslUV protease ATP-binding subunit HslU